MFIGKYHTINLCWEFKYMIRKWPVSTCVFLIRCQEDCEILQPLLSKDKNLTGWLRGLCEGIIVLFAWRDLGKQLKWSVGWAVSGWLYQSSFITPTLCDGVTRCCNLTLWRHDVILKYGNQWRVALRWIQYFEIQKSTIL